MRTAILKYVTNINAELAYDNDFSEEIIMKIMGYSENEKLTPRDEHHIEDLQYALDTHYLDMISE